MPISNRTRVLSAGTAQRTSTTNAYRGEPLLSESNHPMERRLTTSLDHAVPRRLLLGSACEFGVELRVVSSRAIVCLLLQVALLSRLLTAHLREQLRHALSFLQFSSLSFRAQLLDRARGLGNWFWRHTARVPRAFLVFTFLLLFLFFLVLLALMFVLLLLLLLLLALFLKK